MRIARRESLSANDRQQQSDLRPLIKSRLTDADQLWRSLPNRLRESIAGDHLRLWAEVV